MSLDSHLQSPSSLKLSTMGHVLWQALHQICENQKGKLIPSVKTTYTYIMPMDPASVVTYRHCILGFPGNHDPLQRKKNLLFLQTSCTSLFSNYPERGLLWLKEQHTFFLVCLPNYRCRENSEVAQKNKAHSKLMQSTLASPYLFS